MGSNLCVKWEFGRNYCVFHYISVALVISNYYNFMMFFFVIL
jgi:hypothetical protein